MNHHPLPQRRQIGVLALAIALSATLLTACSSKPPGCADEKTISVAKSILLDRWKQISASYVRNFKMSAEETDRYSNGLKLEIREIVSNGYDADARKHVCSGEFAFTTLTGASFASSRAFTSQATAEGGGKFIVQVENVDNIAPPLNSDYAVFMQEVEKQQAAAKKAEAMSRPPPAERELSVSPITDTTTDPSPPPSASPTPQAQPQPQSPQVTPNAVSQGPSFDCTKAATAVERAICGDPNLAKLDVAVVNAYNVALAKLPNKQGAKTEQGRWIRQVRNACTSAQCLADAYQRRLAQLQ